MIEIIFVLNIVFYIENWTKNHKDMSYELCDTIIEFYFVGDNVTADSIFNNISRMAELIRPAPLPMGGLFKDKLGSPSTGSEDGGGNDLADLTVDLDLDEVDGPSTNGTSYPYSYKHSIILFIFISFLGERQAILAPPESEWYHGRLDRYTAEERLCSAAKLGSYLGIFLCYLTLDISQ